MPRRDPRRQRVPRCRRDRHGRVGLLWNKRSATKHAELSWNRVTDNVAMLVIDYSPLCRNSSIEFCFAWLLAIEFFFSWRHANFATNIIAFFWNLAWWRVDGEAERYVTDEMQWIGFEHRDPFINRGSGAIETTHSDREMHLYTLVSSASDFYCILDHQYLMIHVLVDAVVVFNRPFF